MNWRNERALILEWYSRHESCLDWFYIHPLFCLSLSSFFELLPLLGVTRLGGLDSDVTTWQTSPLCPQARATEAKETCGAQTLYHSLDVLQTHRFTSYPRRWRWTIKGDENLSCHDDHSSTTTTTRTATCRVRLTGGGERANMAAQRKSIKHVTFSGGGVPTRRSEPTLCVVFSSPPPALLPTTTTTPRNERRSTSSVRADVRYESTSLFFRNIRVVFR